MQVSAVGPDVYCYFSLRFFQVQCRVDPLVRGGSRGTDRPCPPDSRKILRPELRTATLLGVTWHWMVDYNTASCPAPYAIFLDIYVLNWRQHFLSNKQKLFSFLRLCPKTTALPLSSHYSPLGFPSRRPLIYSETGPSVCVFFVPAPWLATYTAVCESSLVIYLSTVVQFVLNVYSV